VIEHFHQFGVAYARAFIAAVPEPTATGMVLLAVAGICAKRRRR
jgi:hypothetical protein